MLMMKNGLTLQQVELASVVFFSLMFSLDLILFYDILMARVCFRVGWMLVLVYY